MLDGFPIVITHPRDVIRKRGLKPPEAGPSGAISTPLDLKEYDTYTPEGRCMYVCMDLATSALALSFRVIGAPRASGGTPNTSKFELTATLPVNKA